MNETFSALLNFGYFKVDLKKMISVFIPLEIGIQFFLHLIRHTG